VTLTFDPILIDGRDIVIYYLRANFGDFNFSRFGFVVRIDRITESHDRMTEDGDRYTHATKVGVSKDPSVNP